MSLDTWERFPSSAALGRDEIEKILPHRGHMALLEKVERIGADAMLAEVPLSMDAFWVAGHFPVPKDGEAASAKFKVGPIFPGVLMVESAAQAGICLWRMQMGIAETGGRLMVFKEVTKARFMKEARPGDRLVVRAQMEKASLRLMRCFCEGQVKRDGQWDLAFDCHLAGLAV